MSVFLFHASFSQFGGDWLKPVFGQIGTDAVIVFFVLSGLVIAFTVDTKEKTARAYILHRLARLWSVAIPALLLTVVLETVGRAIGPSAYSALSPTDYPIPRLIAAALFVNQLWFLNIPPLTNVPFWSLSYEFWYYLIFAAYVFLPGRRSIIIACIVAIAAGPIILLLFPIWLLGVWTYRILKCRLRIPPVFASVLFALAPVGFAFNHLFSLSVRFRWHVDVLTGQAFGFSDEFVTANIFGALMAAHFIGFASIEHRIRFLLMKMVRPIRFAASFTLSLYLYHFPLLYFFSALFKPQPDDHLISAAIVILTFGVAIGLGLVTERKKTVVRAWLEPVFQRFWPIPESTPQVLM